MIYVLQSQGKGRLLLILWEHRIQLVGVMVQALQFNLLKILDQAGYLPGGEVTVLPLLKV